MSSSNYRLAARNSLRGYWGTSVLVALVASLLGGSGPSGGSGASSSFSNTVSQDSISQISEIPTAILGILIAVFSVMAIYALVVLVIGGAVRLGLVTYNIDLVTKRRAPAFSTLFSRFNIFGKAFVLNLLTSLFTVLWSLLLIVPGIIAAYRYAMAPYIMAENPNLDAMKAINISKNMMNGNKWRLFSLHVSFIGWIFLGALTFGIGYLWLNPYMQAAEAAFFLDIAGSGNRGMENRNIGPEII